MKVSKLNPGECFKVDYLTWTSIKGLIKSCSTYPGAVSSEPAGELVSTLQYRYSKGTYIDKKCPFTGNVSIRGRILTGVVQKMKMQRTIVIRRDYLHYIRKYNRFEKRHRNMSVHLSPCFSMQIDAAYGEISTYEFLLLCFRDVNTGDVVTVGECRPLSKTVRFNVLKVTKGIGSKKSFRKF
ncbi:hypothetical protein B566_EDAN010895 [Ephemera danica]|nr:hypothetical protein B566_EDAN010895 [Ephemera danica]